MKGNDLSSQPVPKILLVWEGALAFLNQKHEKKFLRLMERERWDDAARLWEFNPMMCNMVLDTTHRRSLSLDVITYLGPDEFALALSERIWEEQLPVQSVWATTAKRLARTLPFRPDIIRIYDPYESHQLMFGPKGVLITRHDQLGR